MILKINKLNCENVFYKILSDSIDNEGQTINKIYISKEYFNKADQQYKYNYIILNNVDELEQITTTNKNIYEILQHNKQIKPFLDIDLIIKDYDSRNFRFDQYK